MNYPHPYSSVTRETPKFHPGYSLGSTLQAYLGADPTLRGGPTPLQTFGSKYASTIDALGLSKTIDPTVLSGFPSRSFDAPRVTYSQQGGALGGVGGILRYDKPPTPRLLPSERREIAEGAVMRGFSPVSRSAAPRIATKIAGDVEEGMMEQQQQRIRDQIVNELLSLYVSPRRYSDDLQRQNLIRQLEMLDEMYGQPNAVGVTPPYNPMELRQREMREQGGA